MGCGGRVPCIGVQGEPSAVPLLSDGESVSPWQWTSVAVAVIEGKLTLGSRRASVASSACAD